MNDNVTFRDAPEPVVEQPKVDLPEPKKDNTRVTSGESVDEPIEIREKGGGSVVLDALNINDNIESMPAEDQANLQEVKDYVLQIVKSKGLSPTVNAFTKTLNGLKGEMGLDQEADPAIVLDRISGVVKAWRNLSFIKDEDEKRKIFVKLANTKSSKDMNKMVLDLMEDYEVWT